MSMSTKATKRFWNKVRITPGCWLWTGKKTEKGYGKVWTGEVDARAHRVSWELHHGAIPGGLFVCHKCDNPSCVNPDHLWLGTAAENTADMFAKGRWALISGEAHHDAKLRIEDVLAMRRAKAAGVGPAELGRQYGVSRSHAARVCSGAVWKRIQPPT